MGEGLSSMAESVERRVVVLLCSGLSEIILSCNPNLHITEFIELRNYVNRLKASMTDLKDMIKALSNQS